MASLALGAIGAGVGSMFGYASIGWSIGSFIGGQLFGPEGQDIEGPRLNDKNVTSSAYGNFRPLIYGSYRVAGDVIWSTDLIEHAHKEEQGKGGGGGGSYTSYTYTVSFGLALCAGPIVGVRKIWLNSELVYSVAEDASLAEIMQSNEISKGFKVYKGTTTQTADPTYQAFVGAANAPAYRGTAYLVWTDLDVTKYGGIPNITVEVVQSGTEEISGLDSIPSSPQTSLRQVVHFGDGISSVFSAPAAPSINNMDQYRFSIAGNSLINTNYYFYDTAGSEDSGLFRFLASESVSASGNLGVIETGDIGTGNNRKWYLVKKTNLAYYTLFPLLLQMDTDLDNFRNGQDVASNIRWQQVDGIDAYLWFYKSNSGQMYRYALPLPYGVSLSLAANEVFQVDDSREGTDPNSNKFNWALDRPNNEFYVKVKDANTLATAIKRYDFDGTLIETKFSGTVENIPFAVSNGRLWTISSNDIQIYDWDSETLLYSKTITNLANIASGDSGFEVSGNALAILSAGTVYRFKLALTNVGIALDEVVEDICNRVEITDAEIDVTDLASDTVRGFLIASQGPARTSLEQLSAAYFFDGRESDGVLEFIKRGGASIATLSDDDIGCYESEVIELAEITRTQEEELPKAITLKYANAGADYQTGAQHALRQSVLNGNEVTVELSLALTDSEGKKIVDTMMFSLWENRNKYKLVTWQKYHKVDPADIITALDETLRVTSRTEGVNGLIELEAVKELPAIYTGQVGTGVAGGHSNQTIEIPGPTQFKLLDIPPLRDNDYAVNGVYFAADGYLEDWTGAVALRSPDGTTFESKEIVYTGSPIGQATTVLGNFYGGNVFDETNIVRVEVSGTLESKTELEVLNGANVALIGDEIVQFKNADLVSTGVYDLSGLLRGRMGTELATHEDNEQFVLLDAASTRFVSIPSTDLNTTRLWAALTLGANIDSAIRTNLTYSANNQRPLSPVHLGAGCAGYGTAWTINWVRRSRYRWQWLDGVDVGADEASYDFEVAILDGNTTVRTITVTGALTTTYTNAQQVTDFGDWQNAITYKVRQIGDIANSEWSDPVTSQHYQNTPVFLLHMNGTNGSTTFTDEFGNTVTASGNAQISTAQSKFGGASAAFDGTTDYLSIGDTADFQFLTDISTDYTISGWVYLTNHSTNRCIFQHGDNGAGLPAITILVDQTTGVMYAVLQNSGVTLSVTDGDAFPLTQWVHVEFGFGVATRTAYLFRDGALVDSASEVGLFTGYSPSTSPRIGAYLNVANYGWLGYMDEFRCGKSLLHTTNFTPPTAPYSE
jgi:hypothetical protein